MLFARNWREEEDEELCFEGSTVHLRALGFRFIFLVKS